MTDDIATCRVCGRTENDPCPGGSHCSMPLFRRFAPSKNRRPPMYNGWRNDLQRVYEGDFGSESKSLKRFIDHIEYLEDLLSGYRGLYDDAVDEYASLKAERDALPAEHEAVIAREAIADRDKWVDRCYQSDERALKAEAMCEWLAGRATMIERELGKKPTWDSSDDWLKAAREAVERSE